MPATGEVGPLPRWTSGPCQLLATLGQRLQLAWRDTDGAG
jgi:hypothetical protein